MELTQIETLEPKCWIDSTFVSEWLWRNSAPLNYLPAWYFYVSQKWISIRFKVLYSGGLYSTLYTLCYLLESRNEMLDKGIHINIFILF